LNFFEDIPQLEAAAHISLPTLQGELATLSKSYQEVQKSLEQVQQKTKGDKFQEKMKNFIDEAGEDIEIMNTKLKDTTALFEKVAGFYGEESKKTSPEEFFGTFWNFVQIFKSAVKDIEQKKIEDEKSKLREAAKEKRNKEMAEKKLGKIGIRGPEGHDHMIDELFSVIEDGKVFKNRRNKSKNADAFLAKQEARVREKPLPKPKGKATTREQLAKLG